MAAVENINNDPSILDGALEYLIEKGEYKLAYDVGVVIIERNNLKYELLKKVAMCAVYSKKQKKLMNYLQSLKLNDYGVNNIISGLAGKLGEVDLCAEYAYKVASEKPLLISEKKDTKLKVLILQTIASGEYKFVAKNLKFRIGEGHNNLISMMEESVSKNILRVDNLELAKHELKKLKDIDVIYNSITDPERCMDALKNAEQLCASRPDIPVINHPKSVQLSSRESNYSRFYNKDNDLIFPKVIKINAVEKDCYSKIINSIEKNKLQYPVIVRLAGYQAGKNMHKINRPDEQDFLDFEKIVNKSPLDIYLIEFKDCSFKDSRLENAVLYPKFRAFMVDGELIPIHLFVSNNDYNVHRDNSMKLMEENPWLLDIEKKFCENPLDIIKKEIWDSLSETLKQTGLEYVGVDFSVNLDKPLKEQQCIIFEINAAMRNSMNAASARLHTQKNWRLVTHEIHNYMCSRSNKSSWDYAFNAS